VPGYAVEPATLHDCDASLTAASASVHAALARLRADAHEALAGWHGPAAAEFRTAWGEWLAGAQTMLDVLEQLAGGLGASAAGYTATDDAVRTSLAGARP
jgi:WXG100 family type VII secretion target